MRAFKCRCGGKLFFHNNQCLTCDATVVLCPNCRAVASAGKEASGISCDHCGVAIKLCENRTQYNICNGGVPENEKSPLCRYCRLNVVIPDLAVGDNLQKWRRLEFAKHRVLYDCERLRLPVSDSGAHDEIQTLRFEFKSSEIEPVSTGHANGLITIDVAEADSVYREKNRLQFQEPQRTLVGHFRHELGHYYWQRLVTGDRLLEFRSLFGDEREPSYDNARTAYYQRGPSENWQPEFVSQYASMHPWEDFAETFNAYLDMIAIVDTAGHFPEIHVKKNGQDFDDRLRDYTRIGIVANEFNRDMGLLDLVPEVFTPQVVQKLWFIDQMVLDSNVPIRGSSNSCPTGVYG